jgi:hypothetical protein
MLTSGQRAQDAIARQTISRELGTSAHKSQRYTWGGETASEHVSFPPHLLDELARLFARAALDQLLEESAAQEPRQDDSGDSCGSPPAAPDRELSG